MTLREIDRQYRHWSTHPPASVLLGLLASRFGAWEPPSPGGGGGEAFAPSTEEEMRAVAASFGVRVPDMAGGG
jgi:hypothetical protein